MRAILNTCQFSARLCELSLTEMGEGMMATVRQLAITIEEGLRTALPTLCKTVVTKWALAVGALLEAQTPNTVDLANVLPLETERQDMREQWLRR